MIQGLTPGHALFTERADVVYPFIIGRFISYFFVLFLGLFAPMYFVKLVKAPVHMLAVIIIIATVLGSYAIQTSLIDVYVMLVFGICGFFMKRFGFEPAPMVLGMILGPIAEMGLQQTIALSRAINEPVLINIFTRPISIVLLFMAIASLVGPHIRKHMKERKAAQFAAK